MTTATATRPKSPRKGAARTSSREHYRLEVNSYDRASSLLVSLLIMVGVATVALLIIFFARRFVTIDAPIPVMPLDPAERPLDAAMGVAQDPEPPGLEDAPELNEPQLMDTLNALTSTMSSKVAVLSDQNLDASDAASKGSGLGDSRTSGGGGGAPEPRREIEFEFADLPTYARWYDYYKIELGVFGNSPTVYYASNLGNAKPTVREGPRSAEKRYYFPSNQGPLFAFDQQLANKAGIAGRGSITVQFFPEEAYIILLGKEQQQAKLAGKPIDQIERTVFRVETKGSGFDFVVKEQLYY